jgi:ribose transport system substrate-binding protein
MSVIFIGGVPHYRLLHAIFHHASMPVADTPGAISAPADIALWEEGMRSYRRYFRGIAPSIFALALATAGAAASDNKIALTPGGPHPYFAPWETGAADAKKDFGIGAVDYKVPADWKLELQTELMEALASQGYKGLGFFPGDPVGLNSTIVELKSAGAATAALGGCVVDPTQAAFCLATDPFNASYQATKELVKAIGGKGRIVHLTGLLIDTNTTLREQAVQKAVDETNGAVKLVQTVADTDAPEAGDQKINALLAAQKDQIDGIVATAYITSVVTSKSLRALGDKRIKFVALNDDPIILDAIKDGFAQGTFVQNPYGQAYIGAYALDLLASNACEMKADAPWIKTPQTAHFIDSGVVYVNAANLASYKNDLKTLTADIQGRFKSTYMSCK